MGFALATVKIAEEYMDNATLDTCLYCGGAFEDNDPSTVCPFCGIKYHSSCWEFNMGCSNSNCPAYHSVKPEETITKEVITNIEPTQTESTTCNICGSSIELGMSYCPGCGQRTEAIRETVSQPGSQPIISEQKLPKPKAKILAAIVLLVILFAGLITYYISSENYNNYISKVDQFSNEVLTASVNLEIIGNKVSSYWNDYIYNNRIYYGSWYWQYIEVYDSLDEALNSAYSSMNTEVQNADNQHDVISKLYDEIQNQPFTLKNIDEVKIKVDELYFDYIEFSLCVLDPSGKNYSEFNSDFSRLDNKVLTSYNSLKNLLNME